MNQDVPFHAEESHEEHDQHDHEHDHGNVLLTAKVPVTVVMLALTLLAVAIPFWLRKNRNFLRYLPALNSFATGAFVGLAIFHLLPEALQAAEEANLGITLRNSWYNLTFILLFVGFLVVLFAEKILVLAFDEADRPVDMCCHAIEDALTQPSELGSPESSDHVDVSPVAALDDEKPLSKDTALLNNDKRSNRHQHNHHQHQHKGHSCGHDTACVPHSHIPASTCQSHSHEPFGAAASGGNAGSVSKTIFAANNMPGNFAHKTGAGAEGAGNYDFPKCRGAEGGKCALSIGALVACLAISVHSVFEGIVIGVLEDSLAVWVAALAVLFHKIGVALAIAVNMLNVPLPLARRNIFLALFVLSTPVGIIFGAVIAYIEAAAVSAICSALGVGAVLAAGCDMLFAQFGSTGRFRSEMLNLVWFLVGSLGVLGCMMAHLYAHKHGASHDPGQADMLFFLQPKL